MRDGLWLRLAERANASARRLSAELAKAPGVRHAWSTEANEVFVVAPETMVRAWRAAGAKFHEWNTQSLPSGCGPREGEALVRLVASFETRRDEIDRLLAVCIENPNAIAP